MIKHLAHLKDKHLYPFTIVLAWIIGFYSTELLAAPGLSHTTYKGLKKVEELQDKKQFNQALKQLQILLQKKGLKHYDRAIINQYLSYTYVAKDELRNSLAPAIKAIKAKQLPQSAEQSLRILVAQSAFQLQRYRITIDYLHQWLKRSQTKNADHLFLLAYSYYETNQWKDSGHYLRQAINYKKKIPEDWYHLQLNLAIAQKNFSQVEAILHNLIEQTHTSVQNQDTEQNAYWWRYLSQFYLQQRWDEKALATLMLAYQLGYLSNHELQQMVMLYQHRQIPEKAARLLMQAIETAQLEKSYPHYYLLFQLWYSAHEYPPAISALKQAIDLEPKAKDLRTLALLYLQENAWRETLKTIQKAESKGAKKSSLINPLFALLQSAYLSHDHETTLQTFKEISTYYLPTIQESENIEHIEQYHYWKEKLTNDSRELSSVPEQVSIQ